MHSVMAFSGITRLLIEEAHGVRVTVRAHEIKQKSQKFIHKYNKLEK